MNDILLEQRRSKPSLLRQLWLKIFYWKILQLWIRVH